MTAGLATAQSGSAEGTQPVAVTIKVQAKKRASYAIPRTIFGTFLEPIGNSVYNGLWAEILQNPSFEANLWSAPAVARMIREEPELSRASQLALPLPWEPLVSSQGNRYEPRWSNAPNSSRSLAILGLPGTETGIKQKIYLPVHRELRYNGSLYVMHQSGEDRVDVSIRSREQPSRVIAHATLTASSPAWRKYTFTLEIPAGQIKPLEAIDFVISLAGDERIVVDQASLTPADATAGLDPEMVGMSRSMHTPLVRFGGNFTSGYHWRDGIGPRDKRVSMLNIAWGMPEYNQFGTDEFLKYCDLIGAQPQIALNLGSGTPEEAADWVRYVDQHWSRHSGLHWELGNELWGDWNLGYPTLQELPARTLAFSKAVRGADPKAQLIATGADPDHYEQWNAAQLTDPPGAFNFLSTHFVVTTNKVQPGKRPDPDALASATFALPVELGRKLRAMQAQINESPNFRDKAHIAFTEWLFICCGDGPANAPRYDNMGGAIANAGVLNMLLQNADIVPVSDMTGIIEFAGIWKKRGRVYGTPSYYAFQLYSSAQAARTISVETNSATYDVHDGISRFPDIGKVPYLDVVGAANQKGDRLTLFCVNRHLTEDIPAEIQFTDFDAAQAAVSSLKSDSIYDGNDETRPQLIVPSHAQLKVEQSRLRYTFPHESVTRIELETR